MRVLFVCGKPHTLSNRSPCSDTDWTIIWPRAGSEFFCTGPVKRMALGRTGNESAQQPSQREQKGRPSPPFRLLDGLRLPALPHKPSTPAIERSCCLLGRPTLPVPNCHPGRSEVSQRICDTRCRERMVPGKRIAGCASLRFSGCGFLHLRIDKPHPFNDFQTRSNCLLNKH